MFVDGKEVFPLLLDIPPLVFSLRQQLYRGLLAEVSHNMFAAQLHDGMRITFSDEGPYCFSVCKWPSLPHFSLLHQLEEFSFPESTFSLV